MLVAECTSLNNFLNFRQFFTHIILPISIELICKTKHNISKENKTNRICHQWILSAASKILTQGKDSCLRRQKSLYASSREMRVNNCFEPAFKDMP